MPPAKDPDSAVQVGAAVRTINPPVGLPLVGYPSPRPNTGVSLDLCARALVFAESGAHAIEFGGVNEPVGKDFFGDNAVAVGQAQKRHKLSL